ncbi:pilus assembly protein N-terminal domain-containing protein [Ruegeria arenilitoris]|uniref:pilus assembly protein N-terminal domain-containing protein n=1 Tax=Ruegeria arenilitoris TaxID=1173585 RepID=UPI00147A6D8B|nr:pilus assembly protein N-terminal domain-containing protein [Ruegeria arenilitoris]
MKNGLSWIVYIAVATVTLIGAPAFAGATIKIEANAATQTVEVVADGAVAIESAEPFSEVFIANADIADISSITGTSLYILGKNPGRTTLMLTRDDSSIISSIDIRVSPDTTELQRRLSEVLPDEEIKVLSANDGFVLTGSVSGPEVVSRALEVAGHYAQGKISNLLNVRIQEAPPMPEPKPEKVEPEPAVEIVDPAEVEAQIRELLPDELVSVHDLGGTIVLSGKISSQERAQQAVQIAQLLVGDAEISNLLTVTENQVCKVRMRRGGELFETVIPCRESS